MNLAQAQKVSVSNLLRIEDDYIAFCLDEACEYIRGRVRDGEAPVYETKVTSMSEFYSRLGV